MDNLDNFNPRGVGGLHADQTCFNAKIVESVDKYLSKFLQEAKKSNFPILSKISNTLACQIWIAACEFIDVQLSNDKAVQIQQLGTFSFSSKKIDIGNNKHIIVQKPVFLFSERLAQIHGITYTKHHVSGDIPVVKMNFTAIAIHMGTERDLVEGCIREILQALSRVIAQRDPIQFIFYNIGYLVVRDFRARVKFLPQFIKRMDGTGQLSKLICKKQKSKRNYGPQKISNRNALTKISPPNTAPHEHINNSILPVLDVERGVTAVKANNIPTANIYSSEDLNQIMNPKLAEIKNSHKSGSMSSSPRPSICGNKLNNTVDIANFENEQTSIPRIDTAKSVSTTCSNSEIRLKDFIEKTNSDVDLLKNLSYVAHQRKMINEEKKARDAQADAILQTFQDCKDKANMKREQKEEIKARARATQVAKFNVQTCQDEVNLENENKLEKLGEHARAYIFQKRPLTPARFGKQARYSNALATQVDAKNSKTNLEKMTRDENERNEQTQLLNEINQMRTQSLIDSRMKQKNYRKALSSQILVKKKIKKESDNQHEVSSPIAEPVVPYFGKNHMNGEKQSEEAARARSLFKAQLTMASEKRRNSIKRHLASQEGESQVLTKTRQELIAENRANYEHSVSRRRSLEANWIKHAKEKRAREIAHQEFMKNDRFLHEKEATLHDKYSFMFKPKPTGYTSGRFKSNIWRESRYIPGSRLIV